MKTETYRSLIKLHIKFKPQEFGKICQKILAISFQESGYNCVAETERGVQGVDIGEVEKGDEKYSIEVKTTNKDIIYYGQKDLDGLKYQKEKGYEPIIAVLRLDMFSDWIFARADRLKIGSIYINSFRAFRLPELEKTIQPFFDIAVEEHFMSTMEGGQEYLDKVLKSK